MSDDWITFVLCKTGYVPRKEDQEAALRAFHSFAPDADEISIIHHDNIEFFDCGSNFEAVKYPNCGTEIDATWWSDTMSEDYVSNDNSPLKVPVLQSLSRWIIGKPANLTGDFEGGFQLLKYTLPCCQHHASLDSLDYQWPQAFGRIGLSGMNCNIGGITGDQIAAIEASLKCCTTVIYQHI